jgi:hypothetical protein
MLDDHHVTISETEDGLVAQPSFHLFDTREEGGEPEGLLLMWHRCMIREFS